MQIDHKRTVDQPPVNPYWPGLHVYGERQSPCPLRPDGFHPAAGSVFPDALWGAAIDGANVFGRNLRRVQRNEISIEQAVVQSLMRGAATGLTTTTAAALTANLKDRNLLRFVTLIAATTALSYLIAGLR